MFRYNVFRFLAEHWYSTVKKRMAVLEFAVLLKLKLALEEKSL